MTPLDHHLADRITRLETTVAILQAERDITATMFRYPDAIDRHASDEWADCFTIDGILRIVDLNGQERRRFSGRDEIRLLAKATPANSPTATASRTRGSRSTATARTSPPDTR